MSLLLDTKALIWWLEGVLSGQAAAAINHPDEIVVVSAVSVWEVSIKTALGKLRSPGDLPLAIVEEGFEPLSISIDHAHAAGALPRHHADPFDRLLIAQAQLEGLTIVTRDRVFDAYEVDVLAC
ncbi:MAG: PilT protein domain protein [Acidimicrobiales bacterium]|nr:PilT protein domain protein [Acidimicrobiales bacterium]